MRKGKSAGGVTYGFDIVRNFNPDGQVSTGERVITEDEAAVVCRVYDDYANGICLRAIAGNLKAEGIAGPRFAGWGASTIYGNWCWGTRLLNNKLYVGRLVWNR
ncbi:recombinase family protein [uncultured Ruegeria sp.]|uniref:recombinase family protein n=1 Tax=uncultured Ruegeria sp. TaxID=259304 RepID=UPI0026303944|nr:recombinase family protein [uncultured Ruegeria sp.]